MAASAPDPSGVQVAANQLALSVAQANDGQAAVPALASLRDAASYARTTLSPVASALDQRQKRNAALKAQLSTLTKNPLPKKTSQ